VNRIGFGAARLTAVPGFFGESIGRDDALKLLRRVVELGVNFIDSAISYGPEISERLIGEALSPYPNDLIIATKSGFQRDGRDWYVDGRPKTIRGDCERSLTLLRREVIDLYQLHTVDPDVPIEESVGAFVDLQAEGKVRMIGVSNVSVEELQRAMSVADIVSVQNEYSFADRRSDGVLEKCESHDIAFIPYCPLACGAVSTDKALGAVAAAHQASPAQVAIAWLLSRSARMLPIPGTSSLDHLEENVAAAALRLSTMEFEQLTAAAVPAYPPAT